MKWRHLTEETLAKDKVSVREVGKRLQQDLHHDVHLIRHLHSAVESERNIGELRGKLEQLRTYHMVFLFFLHVRVGWVELVELQQGQVRFQVITCERRINPKYLKFGDLEICICRQIIWKPCRLGWAGFGVTVAHWYRTFLSRLKINVVLQSFYVLRIVPKIGHQRFGKPAYTFKILPLGPQSIMQSFEDQHYIFENSTSQSLSTSLLSVTSFLPSWTIATLLKSKSEKFFRWITDRIKSWWVG